jgi:putative phage-type endonuclease
MKYEKLDLIQGSPEWIQARFDHVTASNVPALYGLSPYKTALEYATEILTRKEKEELGKAELFAQGHRVESAARDWMRANMNLDLKPLVVRSLELPCLIASLDGAEEQKGINFEAKLIGRDALNELKGGVIKEHHKIQVQAQMLATGFEKTIYFGMDPDGNAATIEIKRDPEYMAQITQLVQEFWGNLQEGKLPAPSDKDIIQVEDPQLSLLAELDAKLTAVTSEYEKVKEDILARYEKAGRIQGNGVIITKFWQKGNVDYGKIPQLKGVDLERFRRAGGLRTRITIKKGA